jgi:hypothetical protein
MTLQLAILIALDRQDPIGVPERSLLADVNLTLPETVTPSQLRSELALMDPIEVTSVGEQDRGRIYFITARGKNRAAKTY